MENRIKCSKATIQERLCQTNLISFYDRITDFLDKGNAVDLTLI